MIVYNIRQLYKLNKHVLKLVISSLLITFEGKVSKYIILVLMGVRNIEKPQYSSDATDELKKLNYCGAYYT